MTEAPITEAPLKKPKVITFGCRLNAFESEIIRDNATQAGLNDTIVINTCAVTAEATRQGRQAIRRARREHPGARILVTGCAAQIEPAVYDAMPEVDRVLGNTEKLDPASYLSANTRRVLVNDIMSAQEAAGHLINSIDGFEGRARAFVQVQNGCDHRCTFCIIPYGRGNSRSVPVAAVVDQVQKLVGSGYRELVLSGVDITSYGADLAGAPTLGTLVQNILDDVPDLPRLRLSSLDVVEIDDELERLIASDRRLMPHLHLSLQSGDDMILKRMKRRHTRQDAIDFCHRIRAARPEIAFGADFIAGFPTETEEMFENTLRLVEDCDLSFLHVFPFSERDGTPAARMPAIEKSVRKDRARRLREAGVLQAQALYQRSVGGNVTVLIEREVEPGVWQGRTAAYAPAFINGDLAAGALIEARIVAADADGLEGVHLAHG